MPHAVTATLTARTTSIMLTKQQIVGWNGDEVMEMKLNYFLPQLNEQTYFCLPESVGHYTHWGGHNVYRQPGLLKDFNLHFIAGGKGYVEIEGEVYSLQKGDAFLFFPHEENRYYSSEDDPWDIRWMHFYGSGIKPFLIENGYHRTSLWTIKHLEPLMEAHRLLLEEARQYDVLRLPHLSTLTYGVIVHFMKEAIPLTTYKGLGSEEKVAQMLPLMREKASQPFLLEEWASEASVTPYYFCKLFRKVSGMSPLDFITLCRIQLAKQLLLENMLLPIKEIALLAGYQTASYFNKRFLAHEGITPSEFRKLYGQGKR